MKSINDAYEARDNCLAANVHLADAFSTSAQSLAANVAAAGLACPEGETEAPGRVGVAPLDGSAPGAVSAAATLGVPDSPGVTRGNSQDTIVLEYK